VFGELVSINSAVSSALALPAVTSNAPDGITMDRSLSICLPDVRQFRANQESGKHLGSALLLVVLLDHLLLLVAKPGLPDDLRLKVQVYPEARIEKL
jgi:hypothetical protein